MQLLLVPIFCYICPSCYCTIILYLPTLLFSFFLSYCLLIMRCALYNLYLPLTSFLRRCHLHLTHFVEGGTEHHNFSYFEPLPLLRYLYHPLVLHCRKEQTFNVIHLLHSVLFPSLLIFVLNFRRRVHSHLHPPGVKLFLHMRSKSLHHISYVHLTKSTPQR